MVKVMQAVVGTDMRTRGFTLIELLVTITVMVIMATIAVPGFQGVMARSQLASDYNEILSGLYFARSEAIKRRDVIVFAPESHAYSVSFDDDVLRQRDGLESTIIANAGEESLEIKFNSLGRIVQGSQCDDGCELTVSYGSAGSKVINVNSFGRVGRGGS